MAKYKEISFGSNVAYLIIGGRVPCVCVAETANEKGMRMNEHRKEIFEKFDAQLDQWGAQIDRLKARSAIAMAMAEIVHEFDQAPG